MEPGGSVSFFCSGPPLWPAPSLLSLLAA
uniref:ABAH2 n=1 Tax=Arundo donax TaxID=35708 RepID=A0A0A9AW14_ARUDO